MLELGREDGSDDVAAGTNPADAGTAVRRTANGGTAVRGLRFEPAAWADCDLKNSP